MQISRQTFLFLHGTGSMMLNLFPNASPTIQLTKTQSLDYKKATCQYHPPPANVSYEENQTVFGKILRGESPANVWQETNDLLVFEDIHPRAPLHALIIPKRFIPSVFDLQRKDLPLLREMEFQAHYLLKTRYSAAYEQGDYILCFHVPPFNSVDHLHLHVLAPASEMLLWHRWVKYNAFHRRWCTDLDAVVQRLQAGLRPVPFARPTTLPDYVG